MESLSFSFSPVLCLLGPFQQDILSLVLQKKSGRQQSKCRQGLVPILTGHWLASGYQFQPQLPTGTTHHYSFYLKEHGREETAASDLISCPRKVLANSIDTVMLALSWKFLLLLCGVLTPSEILIKCTDFYSEFRLKEYMLCMYFSPFCYLIAIM